MRLLLDTHTMVWFWLQDPQLSRTAKEAISDPNNRVLVSPASYWELAIKISLGKYSLNVPYEEFFQDQITSNDLRFFRLRYGTQRRWFLCLFTIAIHLTA